MSFKTPLLPVVVLTALVGIAAWFNVPSAENQQAQVISTAPSVTLVAGANSVPYKGSTTLTWSGKNVKKCVATGAGFTTGTTYAISGTDAIGPLAAKTTYTVTCVPLVGTINVKATAIVGINAPTVTLTALPSSLPSNTATTTLSWVATNATACTPAGAGFLLTAAQ